MTVDDIYYDAGENPNRWLMKLKKSRGMRAAHRLLVMSPSNDPFNQGTPGDFVKGEWFADVHRRFGYEGIHLRRLHYRMLGQVKTLWDTESPYLNTEKCWAKLQEASKTARTLRLVDADDFTEKRNKALPTLLQRGERGVWPEPSFGTYMLGSYEISLPRAQDASDLPSVIGFTDYPTPDYEVHGYNYRPDLQPHVVEIWSEAEDNSLHHLARELGINYVPGLGFVSVTAIRAMLKRLEASDVCQAGFSTSPTSTPREPTHHLAKLGATSALLRGTWLSPPLLRCWSRCWYFCGC